MDHRRWSPYENYSLVLGGTAGEHTHMSDEDPKSLVPSDDATRRYDPVPDEPIDPALASFGEWLSIYKQSIANSKQ